MVCEHCGQNKPDTKSRHYDGPGEAYRGAQTLRERSAYFSTCDACHEDAQRYDSDTRRWLSERFDTLDQSSSTN
jgi:hypothetical protein